MSVQAAPPYGQTLARAGAYRLLSLGYSYPSAGVFEEFRRVLALHRAAQPPAIAMESHWKALWEVSDPARGGESCGITHLEAEFTRLFDRTVACSPYESENVGGMRAFTKSRDLADVCGFYKAFGLELGPDAAEMADHVKVELEFMGDLALKEAYFAQEGGGEALEITMDAERAFLRDHLGRWIAQFSDRLLKATANPFYEALAKATGAFIAAELVALEVTPQPISGQRGVGPDELAAEEFTCPLAQPVDVGQTAQNHSRRPGSAR